MATAVTADAYLQQIHTARTLINTCFRRAHELLTVREANLLIELEDIQNIYERERTSKQEELQDLEKSKQHLKNLLHDNDTLLKALAPITENIERILKLSSSPRTIRFQWNTELDRDLQHAGEFVTTTTTTVPQPVIPDYKNKSIPAISFGKFGTGPGNFYDPRGIAIEPSTGRIYIADGGNSRVQVFTPNGEYCFMFSSNMHTPWGICISSDTVYASQWYGNCIVLYKLDGTYINSVGSRGTMNGQFQYPRGIAVNAATGYLYVCDYDNHRVQVFDQNLKFHAIFGENKVKNPRDVNLTTDSVIVLDVGNPCMHIFSITNYSLLNSISRGPDEQISHSVFFSMDAALNIILTDYDNHVKVFSMAGDFITQFGAEGHNVGEFYRPTGIVIDGQNRIVVVSQNKNVALQIF